MRRPSLATGALIGFLITAPLSAVLYLANALAGLAFTPFDAFDWLRDRLPGRLLIVGIETLAKTLSILGLSVRAASKPAEVIMVIGGFLVFGAVAGLIVFAAMRMKKVQAGNWAGIILGAACGLVFSAIGLKIHRGAEGAFTANILWTVAIFLVWGFAMSLVYGALAKTRRPAVAVQSDPAAVDPLGRRRFLVRIGTASAVVTVAGTGLAAMLKSRTTMTPTEAPAEGAAQPQEQTASVAAGRPNAGDRLIPAAGTRAEYTPVEEHYRIDIDLSPPAIDGKSWALPISGMINRPTKLTLIDLQTKFEPIHQYITLECISNEIAGDLIGTTLWTGVSLRKILDEVGVRDEAKFLRLEAADGFSETVPLDLIRREERIMFTYAWDRRPLPTAHGFPLRIYIPDRFGMKQPKWITKAELIGKDRSGYWVERGWDAVARVRTTSVIDTVAVKDIFVGPDGNKLVPIGGIAYSGAKGISRVEVKVDGGEWIAAGLRKPLSETTWVIWRFDWPFEAGSHDFTVRCREADGTPQIEKSAGTFPSGATGLHRLRKKI